MKKVITFIIIVTCIRITAAAQDFERLKVNINNPELKSTMIEYSDYIKKWSLDSKRPNFVISVDIDRMKNNTIFTFNVILFKGLIEAFKPSRFTTINGAAFLIHTGLESFADADPDFSKYLITTYWQGAISDDEKKYLETIKGQVLPPNMEPLGYVEIGGLTLPKSWVVICKDGKVVSITADLHQLHTQ